MQAAIINGSKDCREPRSLVRIARVSDPRASPVGHAKSSRRSPALYFGAPDPEVDVATTFDALCD